MKISILRLVWAYYSKVTIKQITCFLKQAVCDVEKLALKKYRILPNFNHIYKT